MNELNEMISTDYELLTRFARNSDETAFCELVSRYAGLIYFSALRQVSGEPHLAQDIAQVVFANLARKASGLCVDALRSPKLSQNGDFNDDITGSCDANSTLLAGWLHRDTRYTTLEFLRKGQRRRIREEKAITMDIAHANSSEPDWSTLRPLLDETLDELSEPDRNALLLRYFEHQSLGEVARALGTGEDAVRKRIGRALEKLRAALQKRGITTTAAALSALLIARPRDAIAADFASDLARAALKRASAPPTPSSVFLFSNVAVKSAGLVAASFMIGCLIYLLLASNSKRDLTARVTQVELAKLNGKKIHPGSFAVESVDGFAEALRRLREVLSSSSELMQFPSTDLQEAVDGLGNRKRESVPVLREALQSGRTPVRTRATFALQLIGTNGVELVPEVVVALKAASSPWDARFAIEALAKVAPERLYQLPELLKENAVAREGLARSIRRIATRDTKPLGAYVTDKRVIEEVAHQLLLDPELKVRAEASFSIASVPSLDSVDPLIFPVIIEALRSRDEQIRGAGINALKSTGKNPLALSEWQQKPALGLTGTGNLVEALICAANESTNDFYRAEAFKLLAISGFRMEDQPPAFQAAFKQQANTAAFMAKVSDRNTPVSILIDGLSTYTNVAHEIAKALSERGKAASKSIPALKQTLERLQPRPEMGEFQISFAFRARGEIVNALKLIAPNEPKSLFSEPDVEKIMQVVMDVMLRGEEDRSLNLRAALDPVMASIPFYNPDSYAFGYELTSDQMRNVLNAVKASGDPVYSALLERVRAADRHFETARI